MSISLNLYIYSLILYNFASQLISKLRNDANAAERDSEGGVWKPLDGKHALHVLVRCLAG